MVVLELISIPFLILLVICCFLLRTYSQRFLKTVTLFICAITGLVIMSGFILIFQYWDYDAQLLSHVLPYYIRMMLVQYYEMSFNELREGLQPYDKYYIADNIHIYPGWSAFISLVALITLIILGLFLAISWILDIRQYRLNRNNRGPTGTNLSAGSYKPIQQQI
ncbi:hypothetical protein GJ496_008850 [Pomphorhynchus laevis]|nr:hypothetical protein GJ496_008850 [Pomphorhynchus laevis]